MFYLKNVLYIAVLFSLLGCVRQVGLNRTPLEDSSRKHFTSVGFSINIPKQSDDPWNKYRMNISDSATFRKRAKVQGEVNFAFHPIHGSHPMSEPDYLIDINVIRFSEKQFDLLKKGQHYLLSDPCYQKMNIELSTNINERIVFDKYNNKDYQCFFKTLQFNNGDVLFCSGKLLLTSNLYTDNDDLFIKNIIRSVTLDQ